MHRKQSGDVDEDEDSIEVINRKSSSDESFDNLAYNGDLRYWDYPRITM